MDAELPFHNGKEFLFFSLLDAIVFIFFTNILLVEHVTLSLFAVRTLILSIFVSELEDEEASLMDYSIGS